MLIGKDTAIRTPEFNKKMERRRTIRLALVCLGIIIVVGVPIYLLRTERFLINSIQLQGNNVTKSEDLQSIITQNLEGNYLWIFPKSNILLYPKKKIEQDLLRAVPRLASVDLQPTTIRGISVIVAEREPLALYCQNVSEPTLPTNCFFLDDQGFIFSSAPSFSDGVYNVYSSDPSIEEPLSKSYLPPAIFAPLNPFIKSLNGTGLSVKVLLTKEDEYHLLLSNGGVVMWKSSVDLEGIRSSLVSLLSDPSFTKQDNALNNILYIDLRFGNKIFYKFRES